MNSNFNFDFDLGLGSSRNASLNDQRNKPKPKPKPSAHSQPNKPSWTHQPRPVVPAAAPPSSMVGDIFGKSWTSSAPGSGIGIADKNPNLFGDLVNSALEHGAPGNSNAPLRNSAAAKPKPASTFSMGNVANSLPKSGATNWGGSSSVNYSANVGSNTNQSSNLGGGGIGSGRGGGLGSAKGRDPFGSLVDFGSKPLNNLNSSTKKPANVNSGGDGFGEFRSAPKPSPYTANPGPSFNMDGFAKPAAAPSPSFNMDGFAKPAAAPSPSFNMDDFAKPANHVPAQSAASDPLDMLFTPSATTTMNNGFGGGNSQQQSEMDSWGVDAEFGGDSSGPTTEIDGLSPPPAGVNASMAKNKGMDNYKQGQYADAIKWLSWAVVLLEKSGNSGTVVEVLSSRASCYKEVGEYKKAVADCTKVLEQDNANVSVLVQRALLYESMEKYRLGAEDLRTVLKIDPVNRIARSTVHRLNKLAD